MKLTRIFLKDILSNCDKQIDGHIKIFIFESKKGLFIFLDGKRVICEKKNGDCMIKVQGFTRNWYGQFVTVFTTSLFNSVSSLPVFKKIYIHPELNIMLNEQYNQMLEEGMFN